MQIAKLAKTVVAGGVLAAGLATPAIAAMQTTEVAGGTWTRGTEDGLIKSYFYHGTRNHGSSVENGRTGAISRSACVMPRSWARVSASDSWAADKAYYRFCD